MVRTPKQRDPLPKALFGSVHSTTVEHKVTHSGTTSDTSRYPKLVTILNDSPNLPKGNTVYNNLRYGPSTGGFANYCNVNVTALIDEQNTTSYAWNSSHFVNASALNFQLVPNHSAFANVTRTQLSLIKEGFSEDPI